jgi:hypothetical protein
MADLMSHALTYSEEDKKEYFIKPLAEANDIRSIVTVMTDIKSSKKLDFIDSLDKITKAYAQGSSFVTSTGITITQKTLSVVDMKAEVAQNGKAFLNYVKQSNLLKGVDENDVGDTLFGRIIMEIYMAGIARDFNRQIFFGDVVKEDIVAGVPDGSLDEDYKEYDGLWTRIIKAFDAAQIPAGQYLDLNVAAYQDQLAVKQVDIATVSGTAGSLVLTVNGVDYTTANTGAAIASAAAFVSDHAATIAARFGNIVVTNPSGAEIHFTAGIAGAAQSVVDASTGGTTIAVVADTANVQNTTLKTDAALNAMKALYSKMPNTLRKFFKTEGKIMVSSSVADNYTDTIEDLNGSEAAYFTLRDGEKKMAFRNIPIIERMDWDEHIENDFDSVRPHRILFTIPKNLVVGLDGSSDDTKIESWYEKLTQNRHLRVEYKAGTQFIHEDYIVAAY